MVKSLALHFGLQIESIVGLMKGGVEVKYGFTNTCVVKCSKVRHTSTGGDRNNALVLVHLSLQGTLQGGKILGVIG